MSSDLPPLVVKPPVLPAPAAPKRRLFVSRRTYEGLQPRAPKVPTTAEDSLALRAAQLKRIRKAEWRRLALLAHCQVVLVPASADPAPATITIDLPSGDA